MINVDSEKVFEIFNKIKYKMYYKEVDYDFACSFNHYHNVNFHPNRDKFFYGISDGTINENNIIEYMKKYTKKLLYKKIIGKLRKLIKNS